MSSTLIPTYSVTQIEGEVVRHIAEAARLPLITTADDTANLAIAMHPLIVATLKEFGIDGPGNRFNVGASSAEKVAQRLTNRLQKAAEHEKAAAILMSSWRKEYMEFVHVPIEMAKRARSGGQLLNY